MGYISGTKSINLINIFFYKRNVSLICAHVCMCVSLYVCGRARVGQTV